MKKHYAITIFILAVTAASHFWIQHAQAVAGMAKPASEVLKIPSQIGPYRQFGDDAEIDSRVEASRS